MFTKLAYRNLFRNKRRTLITAASVFFAVFFALLMRSLQFGVYDNMVKNVVGFFTGYAQVHQDGYWVEKSLDNSLEDTPILREKVLQGDNITGIVPRLESFALASVNELTKGVLVTGVDPIAERNIINIEEKLIEGDYFTGAAEDAIIVSQGLAKFLKLGINDTIVLLGQGYQGISASGKYHIKGILKFGSPDLNSNLVFLPLQTCQKLYGAENRLTSYILLSDKPKNIESAVASLDKKLGEEYEVMSWKDMLPELIQLIEADNAGGFIILSILYIIIGFGMFGTILMMTTERLYEFGVLLSIGLKRWKLIIIMLIESVFVSFLGVIGGILFGIPVLTYFYYNPIHLGKDLSEFSEKYDIEPVLNFSLDPEIFWVQGLYVLAIAIIINIYPIQKILKLKVVEALRG